MRTRARRIVDDVRLEVRRLVTTDPEKRPALREELGRSILPRWLGHFEKLLADQGFIAGKGCTFADVAPFLLYESLHDNGFTSTYDGAPRLLGHARWMAERPGLARYLASPTRFPIQRLPG